MKFMKDNNVVEHIWEYGKKLISMMNELSKKHGLKKTLLLVELSVVLTI